MWGASARAALAALGASDASITNTLYTTQHHTINVTLQADVVLDETAPTLRLHDLGIEATSMEMPGFNFLHRYRSGSHFVEIGGKDK